MKLSILAGATSQSVNIFIRDSSSTTGGGLTGLVFNTASLTAYYTHAGANATATSITLATLAAVNSAFSSGGFKEIDTTNMPGWYRFDIPNAVLATSKGRSVSIHFKGATNMAPTPIEIELTGWDNQSTTDGGLSKLTSLTFTVAGYVDCNAYKWVGGTIPAVTVTGVPLVDLKYALGTLSPATAGYVALDWGQVTNKTTTNALTGTTIATTQKVDVETIKTNPVVNAGTVTFPTGATLASTTNITAGTITTVTTVTNQLTAAQIATGVWQDTTAGDFTAANSIGKSVMNGVSLGTGLTVAAVSGAVGSVTGAVASVTGSVGSIASGGIASTSFASGAITAAAIAADAIGASELATDAVSEIAAGVWDLATSGHTTSGTFGAAAVAAGGAGDPWSTSIPGSYGAGTAGYIVGNGIHKAVTGTVAASPSPTTTVFGTNLTAADSFYLDQTIQFTSGSLSGQSRVILGYANSSGLTTVDEALTSAPSAGDTFKIIASHTHTTSAIGTAVWSTVTRVLTAGTNIALAKGTGVTGFNDLDASGVRTAVGLASANLDTQLSGIQADLPQRITKNTALAGFPFFMVQSSDHVTAGTGLTVTATRSLDGGPFGACANAVSEIGNGWYKLDLAAGDMNGTTVALKFTATGADARMITIITEPT